MDAGRYLGGQTRLQAAWLTANRRTFARRSWREREDDHFDRRTHKLAEAERHTEEADQAGLAEDAVIKLEGHKANRSAQNHFPGFWKNAERGKSDRKN